MSDLQRIVSVLPDGRLNYNVLRNTIVLLGEAIEARGLEHVILDGTDPRFLGALLRHAVEPGTAVYLGHRFYDLGLTYDDAAGNARRSLFEVLDRPVFAAIQDHPYSRFMWTRIEQASPTTHFVSPTPEFAAEARFISPRLAHFHTVPPMASEAAPPDAEVLPLQARPVDIFMACSFNTTEPGFAELRAQFAAAGSPLATVMGEVYETGLAERDRSLLALFQESFQRHAGAPLALGTPMSQADQAVMLALSCVDLEIRLRRRVKVLFSLARLAPDLKIVVTASPELRDHVAQLAARPNIKLTGRVEAARARALFLNARFAINVSPTYTDCISERICNAMLLGCCAISDRNRHLASCFAEGEEILFMDDCDLGGLAGYLREDLDKAAVIAARARQRAQSDFTPARLAAALIDVMRGALQGR